MEEERNMMAGIEERRKEHNSLHMDSLGRQERLKLHNGLNSYSFDFRSFPLHKGNNSLF